LCSITGFSNSGFESLANVLVMPNLDAANISYNLLRMARLIGSIQRGLSSMGGGDHG
jgi:phosphotransacetylase